MSLCMTVRKARSRRVLSSAFLPSHMRSMLGVFQSTGLATATSKAGRELPLRTVHSLTATSNDLGGGVSPVSDRMESNLSNMVNLLRLDRTGMALKIQSG